jgi:uncharacterized protein
MKIFKFLLIKFFVVPIRLYQILLSPLLGSKCRYVPTCSQYSIQAFEKHGVAKGFYLSVKRILSCQPLGGCGYDPVP